MCVVWLGGCDWYIRFDVCVDTLLSPFSYPNPHTYTHTQRPTHLSQHIGPHVEIGHVQAHGPEEEHEEVVSRAAPAPRVEGVLLVPVVVLFVCFCFWVRGLGVGVRRARAAMDGVSILFDSSTNSSSHRCLILPTTRTHTHTLYHKTPPDNHNFQTRRTAWSIGRA